MYYALKIESLSSKNQFQPAAPLAERVKSNLLDFNLNLLLSGFFSGAFSSSHPSTWL